MIPRFLSTALSAAFLLAAAPYAAPTKGSDPTVITVGGKPIKRSQINTLAALMAKAQKVEDPARRKALVKLVATNLIGQELLDHEAKLLRVQAGTAELDSALKGLRAGFPDEATYRKALKESGDSEAKMKEKIARQIRADKVLAARMTKPAPPTEEEMKTFWDKHKAKFPVNDSLRALQIVMKVDAKAPAAVANRVQGKLEEARRELAKDTSAPTLVRAFMTQAARLSDGPEGKSGGDLQRFHPNDFHPEFRKQLRSLRVGQLSPVFRTPVGFHIVLLIEKYDGKYDSYKLQVMQNLLAKKTAEAGASLRQLLGGLASKYPVKYLDASYRDSSQAGIYN